MTAFDELWTAGSSALNNTFGERIQFVPRRVPIGRGAVSADTERNVTTVTGRFRSRSVSADLEGVRQGTKLQGMTSLAGLASSVKLSAASVAELGYRPKAGDGVVRLDRPDEPPYTVANVKLLGSGDLEVEISPG